MSVAMGQRARGQVAFVEHQRDTRLPYALMSKCHLAVILDAEVKSIDSHKCAHESFTLLPEK
ncbi:MAG TPA: hypothetical protein VGF67_33080 [Ktedonobacteraceae bacterium]|jgi:hypothetical protein